MKESNKVAIARMVLRTKQYLCAIRPKDEVLCLETMLFADEIVPVSALDELPMEDGEVSDRELTMARQLIDSLSTDFEPERYQDEYRERVLELINQKAEGQEVVVQQAEEAPAQVVDLMAALEASLAAAKANRQAAEA
jgi:DNA end-binding protein Ku